MVELKKINDATWLIEKHDFMKVPAYIYATERLINKIKEDRTLQQLKNVAGLQGVIKHAMVMPDGHEGYGFPIGGVAAFDAETGLVSPGGVGYDINCLLPNTRILSSFGYSKPIESFRDNFSFLVQTNGTVLMQGNVLLDVAGKNDVATNFMYKMHSGKIYSITTFAGTVSMTEDHSLITASGKRLPSQLNEGNETLVYPFNGIDYSFFNEKENELALYSKLLGYLFGNGTLYSSNNKLCVILYGKRSDLEMAKKDISQLGYNSHLLERTRNHCINNKQFTSTTAELHICSQDFAKKLIELGAQLGNKTSVPSRVPEWIKKAPLWIKRLFLAGYFGAEMSSPNTSSKTGFYLPVISINKIMAMETNCREFLLDLTEMLSEFGVQVYKIAFVKRARKKIRLRLEIDGKEENLEKLYGKIGFEYNKEKMIAGLSAVLYIRIKRKYREEREKISVRVKEYKQRGFTLKELQQRFVSKWANERFIERAYYEDRDVRVPIPIPSFKEFLKKQLEVYTAFGALISEIVEIKKEQYNGEVYDFTVSEAHKFVAEGNVVSNCGVRMLTTGLDEKTVRPKIRELCDALFKNVPSGVGSEGKIKISHEELDRAVVEGVDWALEKEYGRKEDKERCEEYGRIDGANPKSVTPTAKARGKSQFGTLGAGNHFLEIQLVEKIFNPEAAKAFGLHEGMITVMIHCGSRGYGHQICTDNINPLLELARRMNLWLPDKELVYAPLKTPQAQNYLDGMCCAVNYAFINRHIIAHWTRETFDQVFGKGTSNSMHLVYDVAHNIAKFEYHNVDGQKRKLIVHRKGATRAFPAGREELPQLYRSIGQPVIIPGSMGTASYVLVGNQKGLEVSWGTTCFAEGTKIITDHGVFPIKYVYESVKNGVEYKVLSVDEDSFKAEWRKIKAVMKRSAAIIRISTSQKNRKKADNTLDLTPDHKMVILDGLKLKGKEIAKIVEENEMVCVVGRIPQCKQLEQKNLLSLDEESVFNYLAEVVDSNGCFNEKKQSINIFSGKNDVTEGIVIACLRLGIVPDISRNRENCLDIHITERVADILSRTKRVKGKVCPLKYNKKAQEKIRKILASDLLMHKVKKVCDLSKQDVYNLTVEKNHNYIVLSSHYTPLLVKNCHGAGRVMSRGEAIGRYNGKTLAQELWNKNQIYVRATEPKVISEEAPGAYKNIDDVVDAVVKAGISDIVARLRPIGVVKG